MKESEKPLTEGKDGGGGGSGLLEGLGEGPLGVDGEVEAVDGECAGLVRGYHQRQGGHRGG